MTTAAPTPRSAPELRPLTREADPSPSTRPDARVELAEHPVWPWLSQVGGMEPELADALLSRLDATRAETPSAFWAFCGLATVPGTEYRCSTCGYRAIFPTSQRVSGTHMRGDGAGACPDRLRAAPGAGAALRTAQPRPTSGERGAYDGHSKRACYQIGAALLRADGAYREYYRGEKATLDRSRRDWAEARRHLTALRKMEKLFLAHLWLVWREALGLPLTEPNPDAVARGATVLGPWEMVRPAQRRRWTRVEQQPLPPRVLR